jgi:hypothetical protein
MELRSALASMLSNNNHERQEAELFYNSQLHQDPFKTISSLLALFPSSPPEVKLLLCLILKPLFDPLSSKEVWSKLTEAEKSSIKASLLMILSNEQEVKPADLLCEVVGKLTSHIFASKNDWPELVVFIQGLLRTGSPVSFDLLSFTFIHLHSHFELAASQLQNFLLSENVKVKVKVLKLINSVLSVYQRVKTLAFLSLIPGILQGVYSVLSQDDFLGTQALEVLREIIENRGFLFTDFLKILEDFQDSCLKLPLPPGLKFLVTDCIVSLFESTEDLPLDICFKLLNEIFNLMVRSEEDNMNELTGNVEIDYSMIGRKQISRLLETVGEERLLPHVLTIVHGGLVQTDWKGQYSAVMTLGELVPFVAEPSKIHEIVPIFSSACASVIQKLRFAGFVLITDLSLHYVQEFQATYHKDVFPMILRGCQDSCLTVRLQALIASTAFIEGAGFKVSSLYIEAVPFFLSLFHSQPSNLLEATVKAISAFGQSSKTSFIPYYHDSVRELLKILQLGNAELSLKARVIECLSLCSSAVGRQLFVTRINDIIAAMNSFEVVASEESLTYVLNAWENICDLLQEDFSEYLDCIIPFLIRLLASPDEGINVNTSEVLNKERALQTLSKFLSVLKGKYQKYLDDTLRVALPLVNYTLNDSLRSTSAEVLAGLVESKKQSNDPHSFSHCQDLARVFLDLLQTAIKEEFNKDVLTSQLESVSNIFKAVSSPFLSQEKLNDWSNLLIPLLLKKSSKYSNPEDKDLIFSFTDVIGSIFRTHPYNTSGLLTQVSSEVFPKLLNSKEKVLQRSVLFIIDDAVEFLGQSHATGKWDEVLSVLVCYAADPDDETRQAAVYGLGVFAANCSDFSQKASVVLNALWSSLQVESKRIKTRGLARDNSISAIGKVIKFQSHCVDFKGLIEKWIFWLPLKWDKVEAVFAHELLADVVLERVEVVVDDFQKFLQVVKVVAEVLDTKLVNEKSNECFKRFLEKFQQDLPRVKDLIGEDLLGKIKAVIRI